MSNGGTTNSGELVGALIVFVLAIVLIGFGVSSIRESRALVASAARVGGVVVRFAVDHSADITVRKPVLRFRTVDGVEVETTSSISHNSGTLRSGMRVPVLYDPRDPRKARIDYGQRSGSWSGIGLVVGGVVFLLIGIGLQFVR